jgi:lipid-binding SYLF domain-containing protein
VLAMLCGSLLAFASPFAGAESPAAAALNREASAALNKLYATVPAAKAMIPQAKAILIFPEITKAGLLVGGQYGKGVLIQPGRPLAYYSTAGATYGLQAGAQQYGYAMFFMSEQALAYLDKSGGFEVGAGPSLVVVDEGMAKTLTSSTLTQDIYAFVFSQSGLMAGVGLQGSKITKLDLQ